MDFAQRMRQWGRALRGSVAGIGAPGVGAAPRDPKLPPPQVAPAMRLYATLPWGRIARTAGVALVLLVLSYPFLAWLAHTIDDDPAFAPEAVPAGGSRTVAVMTALIHREVDQHGWAANDPWFWPTALLDNMPNYQIGMVGAVARFSFELTDQIGRTRGSSAADPDLQQAAGLLQYSPRTWVWNPSTSFLPTATTEAQYRRAAEALESYNARLARGEAVFDRRSDNLLATLDRIAADLGSSSAALELRIAEASFLPVDLAADDLFYQVKGQLYAYYLILGALEQDFAPVIQQRDLGPVYRQLLDSLAAAIALRPRVVMNADPDGAIFNSHLTAQGFYLLRARTQLRELTNILQK